MLVLTDEYVSSVNVNEVDKTKSRFTPVDLIKEIKTPDYLKRVRDSFMVDEILPQNCRFVKRLGSDHTLLVVERPSSIRTISVAINLEREIVNMKNTGKYAPFEKLLDGYRDGNTVRLKVAIPHTVYFITACEESGPLWYYDLKVFYRPSPIESFGDILYYTNLTNADSQQSICLGPLHSNSGAFTSFNDMTEDIIGSYWENTFNTDYMKNYERYLKTDNVNGYLEWAYNTLVDPSFIYKTKWIPYEETVGQLITTTTMSRGRRTNLTEFRNFEHKINSKRLSKYNFDRDNIADEDKICISNFASEFILRAPYRRRDYRTYSKLPRADSITLNIGDELNFGDITYYVKDFEAYQGWDNAQFIVIENEDGEEKRFSLGNSDMRTLLYHAVKRTIDEINEVIINDTVLKKGDTVQLSNAYFDNEHILKNILRFKKSKTGEIFTKMEGDSKWYILNNIKFQILDLENINFQGIDMVKGKEYTIITQSRSYRNLPSTYAGTYYNVIYDEAIIRNSNISLLFKYANIDEDGEYHKDDRFETELTYDGYKIYEKEDIEYSSACRIRNKLYFATGDYKMILHKGKAVYRESSGMTNMESDIGYFDDERFEEMVSEIINEDRTSVTIPGWDLDINLKVGEHIIVPNWSNPESMLEIYKITKFVINNRKLYVNGYTINTDEPKEISQEYIDFNTGSVHIGLIRKIILSYNGWNSGDKIRTFKSRVYDFPQKDVNQIIGFIVDTNNDYPLMLCSNLRTLWIHPNTQQKFTLYPKGSTQHIKHENSEVFVDKIRIMDGDFYEKITPYNTRSSHYNYPGYVTNIYDSYPYVVMTQSMGQRGSCGDLYYSNSNTNTCLTNNNWLRFGILNPRKSQAEYFRLPARVVAPDFHNWYYSFEQDTMREEWDYVSDMD